jgi:hypothetical protein
MSQTSARRSSGRQIQRKKARNNTPLIIGGVIGLLVVMVIAGMLLSGGGSAAAQQFPDLGGNLHLGAETDPLPVPYNSNPPTSGYHLGGGIAPWGVHTQPISDKLVVHNLEHGGVVMYYRQDADKATVDQMTSLARDIQQQTPCIVLMPRPVDQLDAPIAVTAWTWMLKLQSFDNNAIRSFIRSHINQGPEKVGCELR